MRKHGRARRLSRPERRQLPQVSLQQPSPQGSFCCVKSADQDCRARLPALYSDFRPQRTLNPDGYRANTSAWRTALARLASRGLLGAGSGVFVLELDDALLRALESRHFGQPLALGTAVREAVAAKGLVPLPVFAKAPHSVYQASWGDVPWSVMGWALRQLGVVDPSRGEDKLPKGRYVIMENMEAAAKTLGDRVAERTSRFDRIFTKAQFQTAFASGLVGNQRLSETDMDVLLQFLARDKGMIEYDGQTIRLKGSGEQGGITEEDEAIASIKELIANLKHQTDLLNTRIDELNQAAQAAVSRKNRVAALAALKSKKLTEASLTTRYATLNQLEEVASRIEQAADQVQLVKVMESSTGVLQTLNAQAGGADRVDGVMDRLRAQMADTDEVAAILAEGAGAAVDEGEIDDELEAMEAQERSKEDEKGQAERREEEAKQAAEAQRKLDALPQVPGEAEPERQKEQAPSLEAAIGKLSIEEPRREEPLKSS